MLKSPYFIFSSPFFFFAKLVKPIIMKDSLIILGTSFKDKMLVSLFLKFDLCAIVVGHYDNNDRRGTYRRLSCEKL